MVDDSGGHPDSDGSVGEDVAVLAPRAGRVLTVCTGNVCRSPYMERRLAQGLVGSGVEVVSAGTGALVGQDIDPGSAQLLQQVGARVDDFAATQVTPQLVAGSDLVLTATREHRGAVVQLHPKALRYCFTWADFADLVEGLDLVSLGRPGPDQTWVSHVTAAAAARRGTIPPGTKDEVDIVDPYHQGHDRFSLMAKQVEAGLPHIVAALTLRREVGCGDRGAPGA